MIYNEGSNNQHWNTKRLSDLGVFGRGVSKHRPRNDEKLFKDGKYPFIQTGEIKSANLYITKHTQEYSDFGLKQSKLWDAGTLCITIAANIAETGILAYPMCFPDSVVGFTAYPDETTEEYMYYIFEYIRQSIQNAASGSIQDNINIEFLTGLEFKVPGLSEQKSIVDILSVLDCSILLNNQINDNLQAMVYDLYMHLFFDKQPNGTLGDIIVEHPKSQIFVNEAKDAEGDYPFFTSGDAILYWSQPLVDDSVVLLNTGGNADVKYYSGAMAYSTDTWCVGAKDNLTEYMYMLLYSIKPELNQKFFWGTGLKHLQKPLLKDRPIYVPSTEELTNYNDIAKHALSMKSDNFRENLELQALRDWLLPMLMNGQATVKRQETNYRLSDC